VFIDRVLMNLSKHGVPALPNGLLCHVIVHEITHVLENIDRHSAEGIMKAHWSDRDYERSGNAHPAGTFGCRLLAEEI
jgi:hypothetical protein